MPCAGVDTRLRTWAQDTGDVRALQRGNHAEFHAEYGEIDTWRQRTERDVGGRVMPISTAHAASCVRDANPSLARALAT